MIEFTEYDGGKYARIIPNGMRSVVLIVEDPAKRGFGWLKCPTYPGEAVLVYSPGVRQWVPKGNA